MSAPNRQPGPIAEVFALVSICAALAGILWLSGHAVPIQTNHAMGRLRAGQIPLWDGGPLLAMGKTPVFYPVNLLTLAMPSRWAWPLISLINLLIAAGGTWILVRCFGVGPVRRLLVTAGFTLICAVLPGWSVLVCLPWVILGIRWLADRVTPLRMAIVAMALAFQFLGGEIHMLAVVMAIELTAALVFVTQQRRPARLFGVLAAIFLGAGLAGIQVVLSVEYLLNRAALVEKPVQPAVWEMPGVTYVPTRGQATANDGDPHKQLIVDGTADNPYDEPIGRLDLRPVTLLDPPQRGQDEADRHWWTHAGAGRDVVQCTYPDDQTIHVDLSDSGGGWLVVDNSYYPGWQASLAWNERSRFQSTQRMLDTPIVRANEKIQTIFVPPGVREVVFQYDPASWRYGLFASIGGVAVLGLLLGLGLQGSYSHKEVRS